MLPYFAGVIFIGMWIAAMNVSSELSLMTDAGFNLYHDPIDVEVFWLQSRACMILPPDGYVANCVYIASIRIILILTILLGIVLAVYVILRRRERLVKIRATPARNPR